MNIMTKARTIGRRAVLRVSNSTNDTPTRSIDSVNYEQNWDKYAVAWKSRHPGLAHIGDEWTGEKAGAANSMEEYQELVDKRFIAPYVEPTDNLLEIGVGGGRTAVLLAARCDRLTCADISAEMLAATRLRLGEEKVHYCKLDGITLDGIPPNSIDFCFCFDTMVHMEPRDIFNYLSRIPALMRGKRLCVFHHANTLSDRGWQRFLGEWDKNLMGRSGGSFSVMTNDLMERFLSHLGYVVLEKDTESVPRDCAWVVRAPERVRL
jgi:SAM-dependent methyltransferase